MYLCHDSTDSSLWAIKVVDKQKLRKKRLGRASDAELLREVEVMKKLRQDNLVTLREVINDPTTNQLYMVQEFCELGACRQPRTHTHDRRSPASFHARPRTRLTRTPPHRGYLQAPFARRRSLRSLSTPTPPAPTSATC